MKSRRSLPSIAITLLLAGSPFVLLSLQNRRVALYDLTAALPYLLLGLVGFLGEKLNQRRIVFAAACVAVACAYLCFDLPAFLAPLLRGPKGQVLSIALPAMLFATFALKEIWLRGGQGVAVLGAVLSPLVLCHVLYHSPVFTWLFQGRLHDGVFFHHLSNASIFFALLFGGLAHQTEDRYLRAFRYFMGASLLPMFYFFERTGMRFRTLQTFQLEVSLSFLSAAAVLVYACFYLYWQKVYLDELTGIPNRRALNERLAVLRHHYSIAMIDIDHFKRFNDTYGHEQGDSVLRFVAGHFSDIDMGQVYRYGGEEFCIIFENVNAVHATKIVEEFRTSLAAREFVIRPSRRGASAGKAKDRGRGGNGIVKTQVTISVGVADPTTPHQRSEDVIAAADQAMYQAKQKGRNRTVAA